MSNIPPSGSEGEQPTIPPKQPDQSDGPRANDGEEQNPFAVPQANLQQNYQPMEEGDATGGLIPYKNPPALIGYYLGYLGLFPLLGIPFAIAAIILGFIGLRKKKKNPAVRGSGHAIFAIVAGFIGLLCSGGFGALTFSFMRAGP